MFTCLSLAAAEVPSRHKLVKRLTAGSTQIDNTLLDFPDSALVTESTLKKRGPW